MAGGRVRLLGALAGRFGVGAAVLLALVPALAIPLLVAHYRRHGRTAGRHTAVSYLLVVYAALLAAATLFPLPASADLTCVQPNVRPFATPHGVGPAVTRYLFDGLLFVPLGVLLRRVYRWRLPTVVGLGLVVALLAELTQYTGDWRLYHCAYRSFDVDDLIGNTLGTLVGALLAPLFVMLPAHLTRHRPADTSRVSVPRRATATGIDLCLSGILGIVRSAAPASAGIALVLSLVVFVAVPAVARGATPGKWLLGLRILDVRTGARAPWYRLLVRAAVLYLPWLALHAGAVWLANRGGGFPGLVVGSSILEFCYPALPAAPVALRHDRRALHDLAAGTRVAAARPRPRAPTAPAPATAGRGRRGEPARQGT